MGGGVYLAGIQHPVLHLQRYSGSYLNTLKGNVNILSLTIWHVNEQAVAISELKKF
jgi:hypothetical protein